MNEPHLLWLAVGTAALLLGGAAIAIAGRPGYASRPIMTPNEGEFFQRLVRAIPGGFVFSQVALSALIEPRAWGSGRRLAAFRRIAQKRVDYTIHEATLDLICVIELDDRTHDAAADRHRDALLRSAGIRTIRWSSNRKPSVAEIRSALGLPRAQRLTPVEAA